MSEQIFLKTEVNKIKELISTKNTPKIDELLQFSQVDDLLNEMVSYRYSRNQAEISKYLTTALEVVNENT